MRIGHLETSGSLGIFRDKPLHAGRRIQPLYLGLHRSGDGIGNDRHFGKAAGQRIEIETGTADKNQLARRVGVGDHLGHRAEPLAG